MMVSRNSIVLIVMTGLITVTIACGGGGETSVASNSTVETVNGLVTDVKSKSLLELDTISLLIESGDTMVLEARGKRFVGFDPSHLRDHMIQGTRLSISFHREGGVPVLDSIND